MSRIELLQNFPWFLAIVLLMVDVWATGHAILFKRDTRAAIAWARSLKHLHGLPSESEVSSSLQIHSDVDGRSLPSTSALAHARRFAARGLARKITVAKAMQVRAGDRRVAEVRASRRSWITTATPPPISRKTRSSNLPVRKSEWYNLQREIREFRKGYRKYRTTHIRQNGWSLPYLA